MNTEYAYNLIADFDNKEITVNTNSIVAALGDFVDLVAIANKVMLVCGLTGEILMEGKGMANYQFYSDEIRLMFVGWMNLVKN